MLSSEAHDEGWKMCKWSRLRAVRLRRSARVLLPRAVMGTPSAETRRDRIVLESRATLKWWSGSKRMIAAEWPLRLGIAVVAGGRIAWAMTR